MANIIPMPKNIVETNDYFSFNKNEATYFISPELSEIAGMLEEKTEFVQTYFANPDFQNFVNARVFQAAVSKLSSQHP